MKFRKRLIICLALLSFMDVVGLGQKRSPSNVLNITIEPPKKSFLLGEIVPAEIKITNNTKSPLSISQNTSIKISSQSDDGYKLYVPQGPAFTIDGVEMPVILKPRATFIIKQTILWNNSPEVSHLSPNAARSYTEGRILSHYAFSEPGPYFMKAYVGLLDNGKWTTVESAPIEITIAEPVGDDLEVWNRIKGNREIPHFLQEGNFTRGYHRPIYIELLTQLIEQILTDYPNSFYAPLFRQNLNIFRANEAKLIEDRIRQLDLDRKLQKQNPL